MLYIMQSLRHSVRLLCQLPSNLYSYPFAEGPGGGGGGGGGGSVLSLITAWL